VLAKVRLEALESLPCHQLRLWSCRETRQRAQAAKILRRNSTVATDDRAPATSIQTPVFPCTPKRCNKSGYRDFWKLATHHQTSHFRSDLPLFSSLNTSQDTNQVFIEEEDDDDDVKLQGAHWRKGTTKAKHITNARTVSLAENPTVGCELLCTSGSC
jgi:hypothetical protein